MQILLVYVISFLISIKTLYYQSFVQKGIGLKYKPLKSGVYLKSPYCLVLVT